MKKVTTILLTVAFLVLSTLYTAVAETPTKVPATPEPMMPTEEPLLSHTEASATPEPIMPTNEAPYSPTENPATPKLETQTETANSFTIRNGITFNSTIEDVRKIEKMNEHVVLDEEYDADKDGTIDESIYKGTILGYDGSSVNYYYDKSQDGHVRAIDYRFFGTLKGNEKYAEFKQDLTNKYGAPFIDDMKKTFPLFQKEFTYNYSYGDIRGHNNIFSDYQMVSQWLVDYSDCSVLITLCTEYNEYFGDCECFIYYDLYTQSEIEALFEAVQEKLDIKQQQKNSDL